VDENYKVLTGDECVVAGRDSVVTGLSLGKLPDTRGEFLGLSKFEPAFLTDFCDFAEEYFEQEGRQAIYEVVLARFLDQTERSLHYQTIGAKEWININYEEDLAQAREIARKLLDR